MVLKVRFNNVWLIVSKRNKKNAKATAVSSCGMSFLFIDFIYLTDIRLFKLTTRTSKQHSLELCPDVIKENFNN